MKLIAGPCQLESREHAIGCAKAIAPIARKHNLDFYFKTSFDKANRTSALSARGAGLSTLIETFQYLKSINIKTLTDIHEPWQAEELAPYCDVLQIPALLSRQTDLIKAAAKTGCIVNIKKGQFMSPHDMRHAVRKTFSCMKPRVWLTERGSMFGYNNLVVDMRSLVIMKEENPDCEIIFDCTHSVQLPSASDGKSGGERRFALPLAKAAIAVGADGIFLETHPDPDNAPSDGPNMIPLKNLDEFLTEI